MSEVISKRAVRAIVERVASSLDHELPMLRQELILSGDGSRIYRLSHPTALDEDVYVVVTARAMDRTEVMDYMPGNKHGAPVLMRGDGTPDNWADRQDPVERLIDENRYLTDEIRHDPQPGEFGPWGREGRPPSPDQLG